MRGTLRLNLPVSYQNLLDGVIRFVVNDGHEGTQTVVPVANTPNNDLYVSADQGGFEITNVHPGNSMYSELELSGNWTGSGKSLLNIIVAAGPRIIGLEGFITWPDEDSVNHLNITNDVLVIFDNTQQDPSILVENKDGVVGVYTPVGNTITVPAAALANSIDNKVKITLLEGENVISYIISLPQSESETFEIQGTINDEGVVTEASSSTVRVTDFKDVSLVTDIAYNGISSNAVWAYDENLQPIKRLLSSQDSWVTVKHITPDGTYKYIRGCANTAYSYGLTIYFRNRG